MAVTINGKQYLTSIETAKRLGIAHGTLRNQRADGRSPIPFTRAGWAILYALSDVEEYLTGKQ
jgi:hypothetical protein